MEKLSRTIQNVFLVRALKKCDEKGVEKALRKGANPNIMIPVGEFCEKNESHWITHKGTVSVHPVVLMAKMAYTAHGEKEAPYKKIIDMLIKHPETNLNTAVSKYVIDWDARRGFSHSGTTEKLTIKDVFNDVCTAIYDFPRNGSHLYMMDPSMMHYIDNAINEKDKNNLLARQVQNLKQKC